MGANPGITMLTCMLTFDKSFQGKGSKHQHSVSLSEPLETLMSPGNFYIDSKVSFGVPEEFHGKKSWISYNCV